MWLIERGRKREREMCAFMWILLKCMQLWWASLVGLWVFSGTKWMKLAPRADINHKTDIQSLVSMNNNNKTLFVFHCQIEIFFITCQPCNCNIVIEWRCIKMQTRHLSVHNIVIVIVIIIQSQTTQLSPRYQTFIDQQSHINPKIAYEFTLTHCKLYHFPSQLIAFELMTTCEYSHISARAYTHTRRSDSIQFIFNCRVNLMKFLNGVKHVKSISIYYD